MWELMDRLALENQVIEGMMGQLRMVHSFNNMLIRRWDPGHVDAGNGWAVAAAWELLRCSVTILPTVCHGTLFLFFLSPPLDYIIDPQMA